MCPQGRGTPARMLPARASVEPSLRAERQGASHGPKRTRITAHGAACMLERRAIRALCNTDAHSKGPLALPVGYAHEMVLLVFGGRLPGGVAEQWPQVCAVGVTSLLGCADFAAAAGGKTGSSRGRSLCGVEAAVSSAACACGASAVIQCMDPHRECTACIAATRAVAGETGGWRHRVTQHNKW